MAATSPSLLDWAPFALPVSTQHLSWGSVRRSVTFLKEADLHLDLPL